jgi:hypothetical protein
MGELERLSMRTLSAAEHLGAQDPYDVFVTGAPPERPHGMHRGRYNKLANELARTLTARNAVYVAKARAILNRTSER